MLADTVTGIGGEDFVKGGEALDEAGKIGGIFRGWTIAR
jgi:hypothetical protein